MWFGMVLWVSGMLLGFALASGCEDEATTCSINSDCATDQICRDGECVVECREARDCGQNKICSVGRCIDFEERNCTSDRDCLNGEACTAGVCQLEGDGVVADSNTTTDATTEEDTSTTQEDTTTAQDTTATQEDTTTAQDTTTQQDTTAQQDTTTQQDTGVEDTGVADTGTDTGCVPDNRGYKQPCECKEQCASKLCLGYPAQGIGFCTQECLGRSTCDGGNDACVATADGQGGTVSLCIPDDTGQPCEQISDCFLGTCVQEPAGDGRFCSSPCVRSSECAPGNTCSLAYCKQIDKGFDCVTSLWAYYICPNPQAGCAEREQGLQQFGIAKGQCIPSANACTDANAQGDTFLSGQCLGGLCDGSSSGGKCTSTCSLSQECPLGRPCVEIDYTSDSRLPIGYCDL